jgi:glycosyltransferase involved in cell wall biosynthesis
MRICFAYPNKVNYSETFIQYHKEYLQPELTLTGGWRPYMTEKNLSIFNFFLSEPIRIAIKRGLSFLYPTIYEYYLKNHFRSTQPDVILAEYGITGCSVLRVCKQLNLPLVVHFHGFDAFEKKTIQKYHQAYQELFTYAKAIVAVSRDMGEQLVKLGADRRKIHFVSCGVVTDRFKGAKPENAEKIVLAVGRFTAKKAPQLTIKAFQIVLDKHPDAKLLMIGKGELWDDCQKLVQQLHLEDKIQLLGIKTPDEIIDYLLYARVFVQHSMFNPMNNDSEGTPTSVLEASAAGLPIVSTRHAGIKDAVEHGVTGFLTEEGDYKKMAEYIIALLENPVLAGEMGRKARIKMLQEYNMHLQINKLQNLLKNSISQRDKT